MISTILANISISGLILLFLWIFGGSLGIPGSTITMIAFGSLAGNFPSLLILIAICFIAAVAGDIFAYELARKISNPFRDRLRRFHLFRDNEAKTRSRLHTYQFPIIFFTRFFILGLCAVVSYVSGLEKVKRKKFYFAVITGEFLYAVIYSSLGFLFGGIIVNLLKAINDFILVVILFVIAFFVVRFLVRRSKNKKLRKLA